MFKSVFFTGWVLAAVVGFSGVVAGAGGDAKAALKTEPVLAKPQQGLDGPFATKKQQSDDLNRRLDEGCDAWPLQDEHGKYWVQWIKL